MLSLIICFPTLVYVFFLLIVYAFLQAVVLEYNPAVFYQRDENGAIMDRYGRDIEVLRAIARFLNFTLQHVEAPPGIITLYLTLPCTYLSRSSF